MGRAKVVYKKVTNGRPAESKEAAVAASSASSPAPALPKKRGRPRKVPKEEVLPAPVVDQPENKKPDALSNDISQLSVSDSGKKRSRTSNNGNGHGDDSSAEVVKTDESNLHDEPVIKPTVITRRQGSRRKSEPRRAAGAFMDSN